VPKHIVIFVVGLCLLLTACDTGGGDAVELPDDPQAFLEEIVANMQSLETFRMTVEQIGQPYPLLLSFDGINNVQAELRRGLAQYVAPNELFINVTLRIGVVVSVDIYSLDNEQWASFPSGAPYYKLPPYEGFDIGRLMADGDGLEYAMTNLQNIEIIGVESLIDGTETIHIQATAPGDVVQGLLFDLIEPQDDVKVDAYVRTDDSRFAQVEVTMLETVTEDNDEPSVWRIEFYDYNAEADFAVPNVTEIDEPMPEVTADVSEGD